MITCDYCNAKMNDGMKWTFTYHFCNEHFDLIRLPEKDKLELDDKIRKLINAAISKHQKSKGKINAKHTD